MRFLKRLYLQGYKTFATRTEFLFDGGITAIVGPNGSGKSNIADGLRWVLGEQSFGALRGKRTEDMIFSGSEQRARLGMAYVSLTFDNSAGWLPIEFSEVEVARRAYRSGENEYFINGNRVRLRDVTELLGSSGLSERTYTVIGQGLIDQALSLRPEERRKLFEEAAGITVHQAKRDQAVQKLAEANTNLTRARDILSELLPRLRYLKGQARRASEYQQIKADLEVQLRLWYGYKWRQARIALGDARARVADCVQVAAERGEALNALLAEAAGRQAERAGLRDRVGEWHRASSGLHRQAEAVQRELAVRSEQVRLWGEQRAELERELVHLHAGLEDGVQRLEAAELALKEAAAGHQARQAQVAAAQGEMDAREAERQAQAARVAAAQEAALGLQRELAERRSRLTQAGERRSELGRLVTEQARAVEAAAGQLAKLEAELVASAGKLAAAEAELAQVERARQAEGQALAEAQEAERQAAERLNAAQRILARLQDQRDLLARLRDEGAGLGVGARAVLAARGQLSGILGALGDLIEVPPDLERAIEAALGSRVQDVVVRRWEDAEAAIAYLKKGQHGRGTFLPLDSLRPGRGVDVPRGADILGRACDLVRFDPAVRPAVELALNHVIVVQALPAARRLLAADVRATFVTLEGEIVRPGGSVTGGAEARTGRDGGILARARTLREMPAQIEAATAEVVRCEGEVGAIRSRQQAARAALDSLRGRRAEWQATRERLAGEENRLHLAADRARQTRTWHEERRAEATGELAELDKREASLKADLMALANRLAQADAGLEAARRELSALATDDLVAEVARVRAEEAVSAGQEASHRARVAEIKRQQQERQAEIEAKSGRSRALERQQLESAQVVTAQGAIAHALAGEIGALAAQIEPAEARLTQLEREQAEAEAREQVLREQFRHAQLRQNQAELALQRAQDELSHLRGEVEKELGLVVLSQAEFGEQAPTEGSAGDALADEQPPLPLNGMVTHLPAVSVLPEGLDEDVRNLRAQIARLGPVNLDALTEYNEVEARFNFLTSQATDLEKAVASLQEVIGELERVMEREFASTFRAVSAQFKEEFATLFGGGAAKLVLTDPDSPSTTGIEIIARPPGKREQGLALLSGGERALTAAALIFSILRVRPTPFCVLDEVDAALDEANIGRFREALTALSEQTQFILITHNRGTIEAADTIYGVSMGADNTSQVVSVKLQDGEVALAVPTGSD